MHLLRACTQAIKLENLTHGFGHPNVLDIKLGTQLFDPLDDNLTAEKQSRMQAASNSTTSGTDAIRLTGFSVCERFALDVYILAYLFILGL